MDVVESMYDGFAHIYGTKEGWKEVGLGMLIGLVGGEGSNYLSGQGLFTEAINATKDQDQASVNKAENRNENLGSKVVDKVMATKLEESIKHASELQNAQTEYDQAESKGDVMGMANVQARVMLTSVKHANDFDYVEEQVEDFKTALTMRAQVEEGQKSELAEHYDIEQSEVDDKIKQLVSEYQSLADQYKEAKDSLIILYQIIQKNFLKMPRI